MTQVTNDASQETRAFAKVYGNGRVLLAASATEAEIELVTYALARATRTGPYIDLNVFRDILLHDGVANDRVAAIASTAEVVEDESYYGPRG